MGRKSRTKAARRQARAHSAVSRLSQGTGTEPAASTVPGTEQAQPNEVVVPCQGRPGPAPGAAAGWLAEKASSPPPPAASAERDAADPCDRLRVLASVQVSTQRALEAEIRRLAEDGHSWTIIGRALGLSRQGARQRYQRVLGTNHFSSRGAQTGLVGAERGTDS